MDTILLLMQKARDRHLLEEYLSDKYLLASTQSDALLDAHFDLCIVDGPTLWRYREAISARKASMPDVHLPVLLVTTRREVSLLTAAIWQTVDDVISTPIHKPELHARVEVLLRARRLSLELLAHKNSQLQKVEANLEASEHRFAILFAKSSFAAALSRIEDDVLVDVNEEFEHIFGISRLEALGKTTADLGINLDVEQSARAHAQLQTQGHIRNLETRLRTQTGEDRLFSINLDVIDIDGEQYILNIARDITEQRRAEDEVRKSEARFRSLFQNNHAVMLVIDPATGEIFDANPAACAYYGWSHDELTRMKIADINTLTPAQIAEEMAKARTLQRTYFDFRHRRADGSVRDVEVYSGPIQIQGRDLLYSLVFDVTQRKEAERSLQHSHELMRYIIEHARSAIAVHDRDLRYIYVSQRYLREYDVHEADIIGKHHYAVFPDLPQKWRDVHQRALAGEVVSAEDDPYERADGGVEWTRWECRPWYEADGSIGGIIVYTEVITERKRLEEQLRQSQKLESVGRLAGGVAHDFNNMLAIILIQAELALMNLSPQDRLYSRFQEIRTAAERSARLTQQLLTFARKQTISPRVLDLNDTVPEMLKMLRRLIGEDIDLSWTPARDLWRVYLDPVQVDQLLANLCINARDAITGVGKIVIEGRNTIIDAAYCQHLPEALPGEFVLLSVNDTGSGMDRQTLSHIFDPFFTTKEVGHGTGLGLATVYGIVKQNGGFINVYSEVGYGTTFNIYLPRHIGGLAGESVAPTITLRRGQGELVLLVEDEQAMLNVTMLMLEELGYRVLTADTPRQALRVASEHAQHIKLVLTDVIMPEMNGYDLVDRLRLIAPQIRPVFMSGYSASIIENRGGVHQEKNYLQKPFSITELAAKLRVALEST